MIKRIFRAEYSPGLYVDFPGNNGVQETEQDLWNSFADLTGADYAYDQIGVGRAAKKNAIERIAFTLVGDTPADVNDAFEDLEDNLQGRIKLWRKDDEDAEAAGLEWAYARIQRMPMRSLDVTNRRHMNVALIFERMSNWTPEDS